MLVNTLAKDIHQSEEFQSIYKSLLEKEAGTIFADPADSSTLAEAELDILLECAIILATVHDESQDAAKYHDIAYRIAILLKHYYEAYAKANEEELYLIFSRLGRYPIAAQYFSQRDQDIHSSLPILLFGPEEFSRKLNTLHIGHNQYLLTNFQKKLWDHIRKSRQLAVCAPTSAGKSFELYCRLCSSNKCPHK